MRDSRQGVAMKKTVITAMILVSILASIGGCCTGKSVTNQRGGYERDECSEENSGRDKPYERVGGHDIRNTINIQ